MNRKVTTLIFATFILTGLAAAQTVEIEDSDEFPTELTGGESFELGLDYSVNTDREVPLSLELEVSSEEFDDIPEEAFTTSVEENEVKNVKFNDGVYRIDLEDSSEDGSVTLSVDSSARLRSGNYNFTLDLLSSVGVGQELESEDIVDGAAEVQGERSSVTVEASEEGEVSVTELDFVGANPPSDNSEFIGGVEVNVQDGDENDIGSDSSGTVRVNFDEDDVEGLDRDSLQVYFYNTSVSEWEALDSAVGENYVEADVDHFSVYSVFGQEESGSSGTLDVSDETVSSVSAEVEEDEVQFDIDEAVLEVGDETEITVTAVYEDNSTEDVTSEAEYEVEDGVVEVSDEGVITALETGTAEVSVSYEAEFGEASDMLEVTVEEEDETKVEELDELELELEPGMVETDEVVELTALRDGEPVEDAEVSVDGETVGATGEDGTYTFSTTVPGTYSVTVSDEDDSAESEIVVESQALTGQFVESASNPAAVAAFLLLVVLGAVFYTGKHRELVERVKELR